MCLFSTLSVMTELSCVLNCQCLFLHVYCIMQISTSVQTALYAACEHGHLNVSKLLILHGANVDIEDRVRGEHCVSQNGVLSLE